MGPLQRLLFVYRRLCGELTTKYSKQPVKLVIAMDEACDLTSMDGKTYRPADILCRIINEHSRVTEQGIWVVFASTTSKVADFAPPNDKR